MVLWLYLKKIHIEIFTHTISGSCFRIICEGKSWSDRNEIRLILIIFETRWWVHQFNSVQSLSGVQLFVTTWTAACQASLSIPQLLEFTQIYVHWIGDAIQPSHPLSSPSPCTFNLSQHHSLFQWVISSNESSNIREYEIYSWNNHIVII